MLNMKLRILFYISVLLFMVGCVSDGYVRTSIYVEPEPIYFPPPVFYFEFYPRYHSYHHYHHHHNHYRTPIVVNPKTPLILPKIDNLPKLPKIPNPPHLPKSPFFLFKNAPKHNK